MQAHRTIVSAQKHLWVIQWTSTGPSGQRFAFLKEVLLTSRLQPKGRRGEPAGADCVWIGPFTGKKVNKLNLFFAPLQSWQGCASRYGLFQVLPLSPVKPYLLVIEGALSKGGAPPPPPPPAERELNVQRMHVQSSAAAIVSDEKIHIQLRIDGVSARQSLRQTRKSDSKRCTYVTVLVEVVTYLLPDCAFQTRCKSISVPLLCFCGLLLTAAVHWRVEKQTEGAFSFFFFFNSVIVKPPGRRHANSDEAELKVSREIPRLDQKTERTCCWRCSYVLGEKVFLLSFFSPG